jgi:hypothetical protein
MITFADLTVLFPKSRGIKDDTITFNTVCAYSYMKQAKGIFIPLYEHSGELNEAIENGAIAVIWNEKEPLPSYTPNHFPVFYTNDGWKGLKKMLEQYIIKQDISEIKNRNMTNFLFLEKKSLKEEINTYDLAVMAKKFDQLINEKTIEGRE